MTKKVKGEGESLPRFFPRAVFGGWLVCDHHAIEEVTREGSAPSQRPGKPLHDDTIGDRDTAGAIADGLNQGTLTPEDVSG